MKSSYLIILASILLSCQSQKKEAPEVSSTQHYPTELQKVFDAHGGLELWHNMNSLSFEMKDDDGVEEQFIDLKNRNERINAPDFNMGYDGQNFWLEADTTYKGNPVFYKNLMFYFYAMPFVLADPGINYTKVEDLSFENKTYPGFRVSYEPEVGVSPEDEYFIHYDPNSFQMAWLGYTVTYFSKEKSKKIKWIRYDDWQNYMELILPKSIAWHTVENDTIKEEKKRLVFDNVKIDKPAFDQAIFKKTEKGVFVEE